MNELCVATTTTGYPIQVIVPVTGTLNVVDGNGNIYNAIPCATSTQNSTTTQNIYTQATATTTQNALVVDNPTLDFFMGILVFIIVLIFFIWFFKRK